MTIRAADSPGVGLPGEARRRVLVFDGAMGTSIQNYELPPRISAARKAATITWSSPAPR